MGLITIPKVTSRGPLVNVILGKLVVTQQQLASGWDVEAGLVPEPTE